MDVVNDLLTEIEQGHTLLADPTGETFSVRVVAPYEGISTATFEGVTAANLALVAKQHFGKVEVRNAGFLAGNGRTYRSREGFSLDHDGNPTDAGFFADLLGDDTKS